MTIAAADAAVIRVAKDRFKDITRLRRSAIWSEFVADVARADLALGRVTRIAGRVCLKADGYRSARPARRVTLGAPLGGTARSVIVCGVIELHIKAFFEIHGKGLHRRR